MDWRHGDLRPGKAEADGVEADEDAPAGKAALVLVWAASLALHFREDELRSVVVVVAACRCLLGSWAARGLGDESLCNVEGPAPRLLVMPTSLQSKSMAPKEWAPKALAAPERLPRTTASA